MFKKHAVLFLSSMTLASLAIAAPGEIKGVDPTAFDVAGVKTGMDMKEAITAITKHFKVDKSKLSITPPEGYPVDEMKRNRIIYNNGGESFAVWMVPRVPVDKARPQVVEEIIYSIGNTPENKKITREAAIGKYGTPIQSSIDSAVWCQYPTQSPIMGVNCNDSKNRARLELNTNGIFLTLRDKSWGDAITEYLKKPVAPQSGF